MKPRILFICIHNSARSQMAEAWINRFCGAEYEAESAGLEPGKLNPYVVCAMAEVGIDIAGKATRSVFDVVREGRQFAYVVTVCDETNAERCPIFPGNTQRLHWGFPDPSAVAGTDEEKLAEARRVRELVRVRIEAWCAETCALAAS